MAAVGVATYITTELVAPAAPEGGRLATPVVLGVPLIPGLAEQHRTVTRGVMVQAGVAGVAPAAVAPAAWAEMVSVVPTRGVGPVVMASHSLFLGAQ